MVEPGAAQARIFTVSLPEVILVIDSASKLAPDAAMNKKEFQKVDFWPNSIARDPG